MLFFSKNLGFKSITVIFIHGTLEIWAIVIAGAAGLILGNSILFPGTFSRSVSILKGGRDGLKDCIWFSACISYSSVFRKLCYPLY
ncbi:MAG: stage II sporulation protein M [Segetibacter sp.]